MPKKVLLDTNFIISCVRQKIDFLEELKFMGFEILIPKEVLRELEGLKENLALKILSKTEFRTIALEISHVDQGIIKFAKENPEVIIATLDAEIKESIPNQKMVIRGKKKLEVV